MHFRIIVVTIIAIALGGCGAVSRLSDVGAPLAMSVIENPVQQRGYRPISMPMPPAQPIVYRPNSLWQTGARAFFRDQRASEVGDILTVIIDLDDSAEINNRAPLRVGFESHAARANLRTSSMTEAA